MADVRTRIAFDEATLATFCGRWRICCLELFGSVIRDDFRPDSDVDVLVTFKPDADWGLLDHAAMEEELSALFDRPVDLISRRAIERSANAIRRASILESAVPLFTAPHPVEARLAAGSERGSS
jgi:predicted nucleotidyltransferase